MMDVVDKQQEVEQRQLEEEAEKLNITDKQTEREHGKEATRKSIDLYCCTILTTSTLPKSQISTKLIAVSIQQAQDHTTTPYSPPIRS